MKASLKIVFVAAQPLLKVIVIKFVGAAERHILYLSSRYANQTIFPRSQVTLKITIELILVFDSGR